MNTATKSSDILEQITEFLRPEITALEETIAAVLDSDTQLVREVGQYVLGSRGKRLRPMMHLLIAKATGYTGDKHISVAAALEIIHTATLVHDDVIDKASLRRGLPSVNAKWGDDVAILIADYLYTNAFQLAMQSVNPLIVNTICRVTTQMCEGEMYQIQKREQFLTTQDYLHIVRHKTAFLFSACTGLAGVLSGLTEKETLALTQYGLEFGTAFQIIDDTLDLVGHDHELGKESGTDIKNGKQTLPLIYAYEQTDPQTRNKLERLWTAQNPSNEMMNIISEYNGIQHSLSVARQYAEKARTHLTTLPPGKARDLCEQLTAYVAQRTS